MQPNKGFIFWPVNTGDSTTIKVNDTVYMQIDLRHMSKSEDGDDPTWPIIDELIKILPTLNSKPFLSTFVLTHPDQDHCLGFDELNKQVLISELWMSPRTFREYHSDEDLCEDAESFHEEAMRRVNETIKAGGDPGQGNRIRIIGYDDLLKDELFEGFPTEFLSIPGHTITSLDATDYSSEFKAFVHAPFKDDSYEERNDCSLAFQITLMEGEGVGRAMLLGDLKYPIVRRIFDVSTADTLNWNILLAPHHCSKSVMYWKNEGDEDELLQQGIIRDIGNAALSPGYIVSSSAPIPSSNKSGDNPPHAKAKAQYQRIVPNEFFCTQEHPDEDNTKPIVFEVTENGFTYMGDSKSSQPLKNALDAANTTASVPVAATGFGDE